MGKIKLAHFSGRGETNNRHFPGMNKENTAQWRRRGFLGGTLVAAGAAAGWLVRRFSGASLPAPTGGSRRLDDRFLYDVAEFERTDPALLLYDAAGEFETGMASVRRMIAWPEQGIIVAGDAELQWFDFKGQPLRRWNLDAIPHCLLPLGPEELAVGFTDRFIILDSEGRTRFTSPALGRRTYITSLARHEARWFVADAGNREIVVCDGETGREVDRFGRKDAARGNPGFNVPKDQHLRVVNPGMLRIETYTLDGRFVSAWGEPGMRIDRFCGCCNPVYFALTPDGDFVTSEKGLARINVYAADGSFKGAVAGPDLLVTDKDLAKRACLDCAVGAGFDVALTTDREVLALDPYRRVVRRFHPRNLT